jgi:hypothetical protein
MGSCGVGVQRQEPAFEVDKLDVSVRMKHIDPHPEMEDMAMRITKERNIIFISGGQLWICQGRRVFMDAFSLESDPDLAVRCMPDAFNDFSVRLYHC